MPDHGLSTFQEIVVHYRTEHQHTGENELRWFRIQRTVPDAVRLAALAQGPGGKRFRHQYRIPAKTLEMAARELLAVVHELEDCRSFDDLFSLVNSTIGGIHRVGELAVYDITLRIAAKLGLQPERVYLHAGPRRGAKALELEWRSESIPLRSLPSPLNSLTAREAEDILCIYKDDFARLARGH